MQAKVEMIISGKRALVDADQVKKLTRKQELVARALELQNLINGNPFSLYNDELRKVASQIIKLNRTIRRNVQFIETAAV